MTNKILTSDLAGLVAPTGNLNENTRWTMSRTTMQQNTRLQMQALPNMVPTDSRRLKWGQITSQSLLSLLLYGVR